MWQLGPPLWSEVTFSTLGPDSVILGGDLASNRTEKAAAGKASLSSESTDGTVPPQCTPCPSRSWVIDPDCRPSPHIGTRTQLYLAIQGFCCWSYYVFPVGVSHSPLSTCLLSLKSNSNHRKLCNPRYGYLCFTEKKIFPLESQICREKSERSSSNCWFPPQVAIMATAEQSEGRGWVSHLGEGS